MIDYFALALTHGLLAIAFWRLLQRDDLDNERPGETTAEVAAPPPVSPPSPHDRFKLPPRGKPRA